MCRWTAGLLVAVFLVGVSGCGTIVHGREQTLHISSRPSGADVLYGGAVCGVTPCDVTVSRRPLKTVLVLWKDGYHYKKLEIWNGVSPWALLGNLAFGGIPGWIVDAATGSFGAYYKDTYQVDFLGPDVSGEIAAKSKNTNTNTLRQAQLDRSAAASEQSWGKLRVGMSTAQVRQMLGEPEQTSRGARSNIWYYPGDRGRDGHVAFVNGAVHSWREPGDLARELGATSTTGPAKTAMRT